MAGNVKKFLLGGGLATGVVVAVVLWRIAPTRPSTHPSAPLATATPVASDPEPSRSRDLTSLAANTAVAAPAEEKSGPPLAPSGDFELAVNEAELQAIVEARYGAFVRSLSLSPAARDRLYALLTERQHAAIDVANAAMVAGLNPIRDLPLIQRAIALAEADVDADIAREHGGAIAAASRDFESSRTEQSTVDQLTRALAGTAEPLAPAQQKRLMRILSGSRASSAPADINSAIFGPTYRRPSVGAATLSAAAAELSPGQLDVLRRLGKSAGSSDGKVTR